MYDHDRSAIKGVMSVREPIFVFQHVGTDTNDQQRLQQAKLGCAPAHKLFDLVDIKKKEGVESARRFHDYDVIFRRSQVPKGVNAGFVVMGEGGKPHIIGDFNQDTAPGIQVV
jgi:CRISPR-associated protein Csd2